MGAYPREIISVSRNNFGVGIYMDGHKYYGVWGKVNFVEVDLINETLVLFGDGVLIF